MPTQQDTWRANQSAKQAEDRPFPLKRPLDFAPFEDAIRALKPERIAELDAFLPTATVPDIQRKFADGSLTCAELVAYYVRRIQQHDGRLNAILELNPDALRLAQEFDAQLLAQPLPEGGGKLRGIPILLKDNIATGDELHTTAGAAALRDVRFPRDAFLVQRLREAGAIILGKTNMSEWANFMTNESLNGFSALGGQTRNPRGAFDVSGSSSGSGAAMAANFAALAIGTETSGSIIAPSTQNGVCGLKPSLGLVSRDAIIPITDAQDTAGPMTRNMSDLALLFDVICARDPSDPMSYFAGEIHRSDRLERSDRWDLTGKRIGLVRATLERDHDAEMAAKAIRVLQSAGAEVVDVIIMSSSPQSSADVLPVYHAGFLRGVNAWLAEAGAGLTVADVIAFNTRNLASCAPQGMDLLEKSGASEMSAADYEAAVLRNRMLCQQAIRNTLANYKVDFLMTMGYGLVFLAACAGFPSLSIPAGLAASGEPVGLLLVGNYLADWDLVGAGLAFELKIIAA